MGLPELFLLVLCLVLAGLAWWLWAVSRGGATARKALLIGFGVALALVAAVVVLAARNWPAISAFYQEAAAALPELTNVQKTVQEKYGGTVSVMAKHQAGVEGPILSVTVINPAFLDQLDPEGPQAKEKAREVATASRAGLFP